MKRQNRVTILVMTILVLNTIGGIVLALFAYNFLNDPSSSFNRNLAERVQDSLVGVFQPIAGIKGDKGDKGDSIVGPQGPKGDDGASVTGPAGQDGVSIQGPKGEQGEAVLGPTGPAGAPSPQAEFRCDPESEQLQYKYPLDEDWINIGAVCTPVKGDEHASRR
jgi:hypothetical protein